MPTSPYTHIPTIVQFLITAHPRSLLDVGLGNGKIGFIARDYLDVMRGERGKFKRKDWKTKIDGIEVFPEYIQDHQRAIYDEIFIGNAFDVVDTLGNYDMIVLGDVLEHFEKNQAYRFLDKCIAHSNRHLIVCIPLGEKWTQEAIYGNPYERHLSFWSFEEFEPFISNHKIFHYPPGPYGAFLIKKQDYLDYKIKELRKGRLAGSIAGIAHNRFNPDIIMVRKQTPVSAGHGTAKNDHLLASSQNRGDKFRSGFGNTLSKKIIYR